MSSDSMSVLLWVEGAQPVLPHGAVPAGWDLQPLDAISTTQPQRLPYKHFLLCTLLSHSVLKRPLRHISDTFPAFMNLFPFMVLSISSTFILLLCSFISQLQGY